MSLARTRRDRPDLFAAWQPQDKQDRKILQEILDEEL